MKSFFNTTLIAKLLLFYIAVSVIVMFTVKFWGDFPTYPPSIKKPISWGEVMERFKYILGASLIITVFYIYGTYLDYYKKRNNK
jgi:hypothetical protein